MGHNYLTIMENTVKKRVERPTLSRLKRNALAVGITLSLLVVTGCNNDKPQQTVNLEPKPALIEIVSPQAGDELSFNGIVRASERADLSFRINGRLTEILVKEGDEVKQGQLLAELDARDAKTALESAELELKNTRLEYSRANAIYKKSQAISKSDLDKVTTRFNLATNRVDEAKRQLEYTQLKAPFDGIIGRKLVDNHVQIQANAPVFTLHNLSDLEVVIQVPHKVVLSGVNNTNAMAKIASIPGQEFPLSLRSFATQPDPISQTYPVALGFIDLKGLRVLPGMAVKVTPSQANTNLNNITIPLTAVMPDNQGNQFVWVVDENNKATKRDVDVGALSKNRIVIKNNLKKGERIIIAGVASVKEGMNVRPYTDDRNNGAQ